MESIEIKGVQVPVPVEVETAEGGRDAIEKWYQDQLRAANAPIAAPAKSAPPAAAPAAPPSSAPAADSTSAAPKGGQ